MKLECRLHGEWKPSGKMAKGKHGERKGGNGTGAGQPAADGRQYRGSCFGVGRAGWWEALLLGKTC